MTGTTIEVSVLCHSCGEEHIIEVRYVDYVRWKDGELIQRVMPYLSDADRELLISRTCDQCFRKIFDGGVDV